MTENNTSKFAKKWQLAKRYAVGERTIERWMQAGLLAFIRVRRVVRFDVDACDKALLEYGLLS
jgi:excisionase family DNA binding protein